MGQNCSIVALVVVLSCSGKERFFFKKKTLHLQPLCLGNNSIYLTLTLSLVGISYYRVI